MPVDRITARGHKVEARALNGLPPVPILGTVSFWICGSAARLQI